MAYCYLSSSSRLPEAIRKTQETKVEGQYFLSKESHNVIKSIIIIKNLIMTKQVFTHMNGRVSELSCDGGVVFS